MRKAAVSAAASMWMWTAGAIMWIFLCRLVEGDGYGYDNIYIDNKFDV